jgi:hypothetical protein
MLPTDSKSQPFVLNGHGHILDVTPVSTRHISTVYEKSSRLCDGLLRASALLIVLDNV